MGIRKPPSRRPRAGTMMKDDDDFKFFGRSFGRRQVYTGALMAVVAVIAAFWWFHGRDFYTEIQADTVRIAGNDYPVTEFRGIEAAGSPDKLRACFRIRDEIFAPPASNPQPRVAPGWFKCFYPDRIIEELAAGKAWVYLAEYNNPPGYDRIVVVYDSPRDANLRAFMWRQPNENFVE